MKLVGMLEAVPPGTLFSAYELLEWIRKKAELSPATRTKLEHQSDAQSQTVTADLSVEAIASLEGKALTTVRTWLNQGDFPGAYKLNRKEWRVPPSSYDEWKENQRRGRTRATKASRSEVNLGSWREVKKKRAS